MYNFTRYKSGTSLGDQCNNPGAINTGSFSRRFDGVLGYEGTPGNRTAIFPTWAHGCAAVAEIMLWRASNAITVQDYLVGGDQIEPSDSYSGGQPHYVDTYMKVFRQARIPKSAVIQQDRAFIRKMINAHCVAEGVAFRLKAGSEDEDAMWVLLKHRSKNLDRQINLEA